MTSQCQACLPSCDFSAFDHTSQLPIRSFSLQPWIDLHNRSVVLLTSAEQSLLLTPVNSLTPVSYFELFFSAVQ
nr:unnamed protein product [Haemonchus contortus]